MADPNDQPRREQIDPGTTSTSLFQKMKRGDVKSWSEMVMLYYAWVYSRVRVWFFRRNWPESDVVDVVQEVFLAVKKSFPTFRRESPEDTLRGWIWGITKYKLHDYARGHYQEQPLYNESEIQSSPPLDELDENTVLSSTAHLVRRALELIRPEFNDQRWEAFWRVTVDVHSPADVAEDLKVSRNVVYKAKSDVLRRLRLELGDL